MIRPWTVKTINLALPAVLKILTRPPHSDFADALLFSLPSGMICALILHLSSNSGKFSILWFFLWLLSSPHSQVSSILTCTDLELGDLGPRLVLLCSSHMALSKPLNLH